MSTGESLGPVRMLCILQEGFADGVQVVTLKQGHWETVPDELGGPRLVTGAPKSGQFLHLEIGEAEGRAGRW
jgi:hypothetical protein